MKYHGRTQFVAINTPANSSFNANMQGYLIEIDLPLEQDLGDITVAGSVGHRWYPGLQKVSGSFKFMVDDSVNATWNTFANFGPIQQANPANTWSANYGLNGVVAGNPKVSFNFLIKSVTIPVKVADVDTFTVAWEADNGFVISTW